MVTRSVYVDVHVLSTFYSNICMWPSIYLKVFMCCVSLQTVSVVQLLWKALVHLDDLSAATGSIMELLARLLAVSQQGNDGTCNPVMHTPVYYPQYLTYSHALRIVLFAGTKFYEFY